MNEKKLFPILKHLLKRILLAELILLTIVGLICWLTNNLTFLDLGNGMVYAGVGAVLLGTLSVAGGWSGTRSFEMQYGQSAGDMDLAQRARQMLDYLDQMYSFAVLMFVVGILSILLGVLIHRLGGVI